MKVLLYGGTFDPPHLGHVHNLQAAAACAAPDAVIVMPAGVPPHKAASATPAALRLAMARAAFGPLAGTAAIPRLEISDWEIRQAAAGARNYTLLTLRMLARRYPGAALYAAIGSDMLLTFDEWYGWREILRRAQIVVTSREADDTALLRQKAAVLDPGGARILFAPAPPLPMASHTLRARLAAGDPCAAALPAAVRRIIARAGLYRAADRNL